MSVDTVLDASAILAFLWGEPGCEAVNEAFVGGTVGCTLANWSEVVAKVTARGANWNVAEVALIGHGLTLLAIDESDAVEAGRMWAKHPSLSLGDRLCLAVGERLGAAILTADGEWAAVSPLVHLIR